MVFQNKAALWLLLGIPILLIIYLIRSHHEDYPVSSTYIWKLSAKFRKKRLPMQKLRRMLLFITQLLLIAAVAFALAGPSIKNGDSCNYILIVDGSASMNSKDEDGRTRFERALEKAAEFKDKINAGHSVSVIYAADSSAIMLRSSTSANELKQTLSNLSCSNGRLELSNAIALAETLASDSSKSELVVITDSDYECTEGTSVINVSSNEWNIFVSDVQMVNNYSSTGFKALLYSEGKATTVTVGLKIDGVIKDVCEVYCDENQTTTVSFLEQTTKSFSTAEVYVIANDSLSLDNSYILCNQKSSTVNVLLLSSSPFYLQSCLESLSNCKVTIADTDEDMKYEGYNLYIFDGITPEKLPEDGSILFINTDTHNIVGLEQTVEREDLVTTGNSAYFTKKLSGLLNNISSNSIYLSSYTPLLADSGWDEALFCGTDCVMCATVSESGLVKIVLGFDLHSSNLPLLPDFVYLMNNIIECALPEIIYENEYDFGESIDFLMLPSAEGLYLSSPSGEVLTLSAGETTLCYTPAEIGLYTAVEKIGDGGSYADFFVHIASTESITPEKSSIYVSLSGNLGEEAQTSPALTPLWFYFLLAALILLIIEWEVYYYEQY